MSNKKTDLSILDLDIEPSTTNQTDEEEKVKFYLKKLFTYPVDIPNFIIWPEEVIAEGLPPTVAGIQFIVQCPPGAPHETLFNHDYIRVYSIDWDNHCCDCYISVKHFNKLAKRYRAIDNTTDTTEKAKRTIRKTPHGGYMEVIDTFKSKN